MTLVEELGIGDKVNFAGWIDNPDSLRQFYSKAFCSASPAFAGLGLTQSLGFGVPMVVADDEPHSPEIELESTGAGRLLFLVRFAAILVPVNCE